MSQLNDRRFEFNVYRSNDAATGKTKPIATLSKPIKLELKKSSRLIVSEKSGPIVLELERFTVRDTLNDVTPLTLKEALAHLESHQAYVQLTAEAGAAKSLDELLSVISEFVPKVLGVPRASITMISEPPRRFR